MKSKTVWESVNYKLRIEFINENGGSPHVDNEYTATGRATEALAPMSSGSTYLPPVSDRAQS